MQFTLENMHRGLEQLYMTMERYAEAVEQTELLIDFYQRHYAGNDSILHNMLAPTNVRLGDNYLAAGRFKEARVAYETSLKMRQEVGSDLFGIQGVRDRLKNLDKVEKAAAATE